MNGPLFANYNFNSSSSISSSPQSRQEYWLSNSPGPSGSSKSSKAATNVKSLSGSPITTNDSSFASPSRSGPFANGPPSRAWIPPPSPSSPRSSPQRFLDKSKLGYLAFPTIGSPLANNTAPASDGSHLLDSSDTSTVPAKMESAKQPPRSVDPLQERHRARLELEEAERIRGEEDWVRSGGILRDSEGKRDFPRTEKVREEIRLREWEKGAQERWDEYERRWAELQAKERKGDAEITFNDIPWPVDFGERGNDQTKSSKPGTWGTVAIPPKVKLSDITRENVETFLTDGLKVRGCKVTRKERVRTSFLRWHPDKMTALVSKVTEDDRKDVEDGISAVVRCLQDMNFKH
ncbi:hypothetical protein DFH05DRAFT_1480093 [Lentinula detonsa]|uniref:Uncharacterized protein n=1 Tax=Lentinula detonsa TaxID=2804962 RepID=A0A9W8U0G9_9AGAR|nr:hypothetical protein DFH05DRAFT_1480093 [Lentinula detonsa]